MRTSELKTRRWTRHEYDDLVARGVLTPNDRVELIEGEIVPKMPQNVPQYWIVNLRNRVLEGYRDPVADPSDPSNARFQSRQVIRDGDTIVPLAAPTARIAVADLLP